MTEYTAKQGDTVDLICWKFYGTTRGGVVEAVYEANRGLAGIGLYIPAGTVIQLPELAAPAVVSDVIHIWD